MRDPDIQGAENENRRQTQKLLILSVGKLPWNLIAPRKLVIGEGSHLLFFEAECRSRSQSQ